MAEQITLDFDAPLPPAPVRRLHPVTETAEQAAERAGRNADPEWMTAALAAVRQVAARHARFTTDDVWAVLASSGKATPENRAMGAVMRRAAKDGIITSVTPAEYRTSVRPECHGRPVRVWQSAAVGQSPNRFVRSA